jgi:lipoprotein NlpD
LSRGSENHDIWSKLSYPDEVKPGLYVTLCHYENQLYSPVSGFPPPASGVSAPLFGLDKRQADAKILHISYCKYMSYMNIYRIIKSFIIIFLGLFYLSACQGIKHVPGQYHIGHGVYHLVQSGQTLYSIAKVYEIDVDYLQRTNGIPRASKLQVGQKLWVPGARVVRYVPPSSTPPPASHKDKSLTKRVTPGKPSARKNAYSRLSWPIKGILTSRFGRRNGRNHEGIDIGAKKGTPIRAAAAGKVVFSGWGPTGYGKMVIIKHVGNLTTVYAHNDKNWVKKNMKVKKGQQIAAVGSTGRSTGPHLHFEVRNDTHAKNPLNYLSKK